MRPSELVSDRSTAQIHENLLDRGNASPAGAGLFTLLYVELHRLAEAKLRRAGGVTLGATTLVHEAYLRMMGHEDARFPDRSRFLAYASRVMRSLVIDHARQRQAQKRARHLSDTLDDEALPAGHREAEESLTSLCEALQQLTDIDAKLAELVDLRFFAGCSFAEIAVLRNVCERTVQRDWCKARLLLKHALVADLDVLRSLELPS
jgi:RNA polymerase sigma factor (TIGR02999 family)